MTTDVPLHKLISDLLHPDKNVRIDAALEIGKRGDEEALAVLLARLGDEPDFFVRENVTWAVVRMGDAAVLPLIALLEGGDDAARYNAAHTLSKIADARAVPALLSALDDSSPALVQKAAYALGALRDERALPALLSRIDGASGAMRSTLHDAVAAFGARAAAPLQAILEATATSLTSKVEAVEILGSIGGSAVIPSLAEAVQHEAWEVRFAAVNALRRQTDAAAVSSLALATQDVHPRVRLLAARAMQDLT